MIQLYSATFKAGKKGSKSQWIFVFRIPDLKACRKDGESSDSDSSCFLVQTVEDYAVDLTLSGALERALYDLKEEFARLSADVNDTQTRTKSMLREFQDS